MTNKESAEEYLEDAKQTLDSLRQVIVSQRQKWREGLKTKTSSFATRTDARTGGLLDADEVRAELYNYIAKLYKESEVLEHMINRIENDLEKAGALSHSGFWTTEVARAAWGISRND